MHLLACWHRIHHFLETHGGQRANREGGQRSRLPHSSGILRRCMLLRASQQATELVRHPQPIPREHRGPYCLPHPLAYAVRPELAKLRCQWLCVAGQKSGV